MTNSRYNFIFIVKLGGKLNINGIHRKIKDGTMSPDVENSIIVRFLDVGKTLSRGQLLLHNIISEEGHALIILE